MSYKKHIVDTMKRLYKSRFISIRDGNVSFKPKNESFFYISAGQVKKNELNIDQVIKVHFNKSENLTTSRSKDNCDLVFENKGPYFPSREIYMHSHLQTMPENYGKDLFVVHAHPPNIIAYTGLQQHNELHNIKDVFPELNVGEIGLNVKYHVAGTYELANNCFTNLQNNEVVALERHGSLSVGTDIDKIIEDIETLEYYTEIALKAHK